MAEKRFLLHQNDIAPVAIGYGACIATDRILIDGMPVGYMYREAPNNKQDSGWRIFSGDESETYLSDLNNSGVYDLNTLVNYDPDIIELLKSPVGSEFERDSNGVFRLIE